MDWAALILGLVKLLSSVTQWLHDQKLINAGKAETIATELTGQADAIRKALAAREAARSTAVNNPDSVLRDDDGFKRE